MAAPKVLHGARAQLMIVDPNSGDSKPVGIFNNVSYSLVYDTQPAFILGRFSPAEIGYTAQEPIQITATGWRVVNAGPHRVGKVPRLQDLIRHEYIELALFDRQTNQRVAKVHSVRPTGYSTTVTSRQLEEITVTFTGLLLDDEDTDNVETAGASDLP